MCPNKLVLPDGFCFGCTLPYRIGNEDFHGEQSMRSKCESPGKDKIVPMCWHAYRYRKRELSKWAGFPSFEPPSSISPSGFAAWLGKPKETSDGGGGGGGGITNAVLTFLWHYNNN
jgi:hypothetical protein